MEPIWEKRRKAMAVPWKVMTKIRNAILREVGGEDNWTLSTGEKVKISERFFTYDRSSRQIVSNTKFNGAHFIFDLDGNLINVHRD